MSDMRLSGVILAKNEEVKITKAIDSLYFCDEIVVIDDSSLDNTAKVAKEHGAEVYLHNLNGDFAGARNFGIKKSRGEWVLFLDADEEISQKLADNIEKLVKKEKIGKVAYYIKRRDYWWGKELRYGEVLGARNKGFMRLVKKHSGIWVHPVHEVFQATSLVGSLSGYINHYPHPTAKEFLEKINFYSTLRAKELVRMGRSSTFITIILYPFGKFFLTYFLRRGFLDGPAGFAYAFFMSFHSFLVRAKLYQYTKLRLSS